MNNIKRKNIILNINNGIKNTCPNVFSDINIQDSQIIYSAINNTMHKMLENDLFIERDLISKYNYRIGPKNLNYTNFDNKCNGYKGLSVDEGNNIKFLKRVNDDLSKTLTATDVTICVNFITTFVDQAECKNYILVGTTSGLWYAEYTDTTFSKFSKYTANYANAKFITYKKNEDTDIIYYIIYDNTTKKYRIIAFNLELSANSCINIYESSRLLTDIDLINIDTNATEESGVMEY